MGEQLNNRLIYHTEREQEHKVHIPSKERNAMRDWLDENCTCHWSAHTIPGSNWERISVSFADLATATLFRLRF